MCKGHEVIWRLQDGPRNPYTTFDSEEFKPRKHYLEDLAYAIAALLGVQVTKLGIPPSTLH
ncbi:hypothetical protein J5U21_02268 [Saccharolobus shibatae]|uniref:Uncharacterized protein n=1 Tax=Saccharolobus shibatae TaxID=2286 RepID=A0A8F5BW77_9CREN|nr:hypothetical protein J5U21_02268 [Saccharolobus shibatae]